jgi:hypothetical protein
MDKPPTVWGIPSWGVLIKKKRILDLRAGNRRRRRPSTRTARAVIDGVATAKSRRHSVAKRAGAARHQVPILPKVTNIG